MIDKSDRIASDRSHFFEPRGHPRDIREAHMRAVVPDGQIDVGTIETDEIEPDPPLPDIGKDRIVKIAGIVRV